MPMSDMLLTKRHLLGGSAVAALSVAFAAFADTASAANASTAAGGQESTASGDDAVPPADGDVNMTEVLKPGPLPEIALGKEDAPVKIVEYMSLTCPHCAHFAVTTFETIKQKYIDTGKVRFIIREFPFDPRAAAAFMLARCAPQEQYMPMVEMLFKQQIAWASPDVDGRAALLQMSKLAGFTEDSFTKCLTNQKLLDDVNSVRERAAKDFGVNATPTFLINGKRYAGDMSVNAMSKLIDGLL
ncbi:disulfide bond formation protein DsbA [Rhizobium sp. AC27/96]|uniref:DsbA family protein n=1 Tax=Rhizobium TaxID=379 RepID=UPI000827709B|nr:MULTISPECIES: DsbA family protein [Rhizobium]NTF41220.1 DsbA family protein [Rhizobium rhizogenes]OCJ11646.1 disulfide bond formation protein DsbA [Rhizobium sp. AC27/96]